MCNLIEIPIEGDVEDQIHLDENEFVIHLSDCKGNCDQKLGALRSISENSLELNWTLKVLETHYETHEKSSCELCGSFVPCGKFGLLLTHCIDGLQEGSVKHDILRELTKAARDMLMKLPCNCVIHSERIFFHSQAAPAWPEICAALEELLLEFPAVTWLVWNRTESFEEENILIGMDATLVQRPSIRAGAALGNAASGDVDMRYLPEETNFDLASGKTEDVEKMMESRRFKNLRNSINLAKLRSTKALSGTRHFSVEETMMRNLEMMHAEKQRIAESMFEGDSEKEVYMRCWHFPTFKRGRKGVEM